MTERTPIPAAERTLRLLRYLASQPRPVPAATAARQLGLPRSTTYRLLGVLEEQGFVTYLPEARRYGLGVAAFEIGSAYLRHDGLERLARPLLARLAAATEDTVHLGVLDGRELLYLLKEVPARPDPLVTEVGVRLPAHLTASGRCLLAGVPAAQVTATFPTAATLTDRTGRGPSTVRELRAQLAADAAAGWSSESGEITEGFASVAVAANDHAGRPVASIGATFRCDRRDPETWPRLAAALRGAADELTRRLGGSPAT